MAAVALFAAPESASAQAFWNWGAGDQGMRPAAQPKRAKIKRKVEPADIHAKNAAKPVGPLVITVSIEKQRVKVYDANGLFAEAPVSTGTKTHPTPMGVFSIIQKNRYHYSNLYGAAPMPYMRRITWSGVAMHTGMLPGYAASHGCIRMPNEFASRMWTWTKMGTRVIVSGSEAPAPKDFSHPKLVAKMAPLPTVSAAPAASPTLAQAAPPQADVAAQRRTADASEAIAGMKGTLTDVGHGSSRTVAEATPPETKASEAKAVEATAVATPIETTPADAARAAADAVRAAADAVRAAAQPQPLGYLATRGEPVDAKADTAPVRTAEKTVPGDNLAVKPEDRNNNDDSETTAATPEPAQKAEEKKAEPKSVAAPVEAKPVETKPVETKAVETKPVETKPVEPVQEIAKPADIIKPVDVAKPADTAKPADVAAPVAAPEPVKPVVAAAPPRRNNHVAVFISRKDKKLYIRHGYEPVYDTPIEIAAADRPLGTHIFTARGDKDDALALHWSVVSPPVIARGKAEPKHASRQVAAKAAPAPVQVTLLMPGPAEALDRITIPDEAMEKIASIISAGGSLLISDYGLTAWETGKGTDFIVPLRQ